MGYDLTNERDEYFRLNTHSWRPLLAIAEIHGWTPMGTTLADAPDWDGSYCSNDGQVISKTDAAALASALELALDDLPDVDTQPTMVVFVQDLSAARLWEQATYRSHPDFALHPLEQPIIIMTAEQFKPGMNAPDVLLCKSRSEYKPSPVDVWSGESAKNILRQFIAFARGGWIKID